MKEGGIFGGHSIGRDFQLGEDFGGSFFEVALLCGFGLHLGSGGAYLMLNWRSKDGEVDSNEGVPL